MHKLYVFLYYLHGDCCLKVNVAHGFIFTVLWKESRCSSLGVTSLEKVFKVQNRLRPKHSDIAESVFITST